MTFGTIFRLLPLLLACGCAEPACQSMVEAKLFFGLTNEAEFARFLDANVTPRFPSGLSVLTADGRWRAPDGRMTQERSKLVIIVSETGPKTLQYLQAIRSEYRAQFNQQSVGLDLTPVCASF